MARILCITSGLTGMLNASFELVSRLNAAGHTCICASPKLIGDKVTAQGLDFIQLDPVNYDPSPVIQPKSANEMVNKIYRWIFKLKHVKVRRQQAVSALGMDKFLDKIVHFDPDLTIVDVELHEHIMTMVSSKYKVLLLSQWFALWNRSGLPPLVLDTIPGRGFRGSKLGLMISWRKIILKRWWMFAKKKITSMGTDRRSILKKYAREVSFSNKYIRENYWPGPFTYDLLPVISMTSDYLEFPHDLRLNHAYVGPMVKEDRVSTESNSDVVIEIAEILERKNEQRKKLIYCSVSTFKSGDAGFVSKVIQAVQGCNEWILIVGLGGKLDGEFKSELPKNVFAFDFVPQLMVLKHADLSINHGGIHTINECVHFKVPMLVYSGKQSDQNGCAARVQYHNLGLMADKDVDTFLDIRSKIDKILSDASIQEATCSLQLKNKHYEIERILENQVDKFIKKSQM